MIQRCASTGKYQFPPTTFCQGAGLETPEWVQASGKGTVFSWIVVRHPVPKDIYASEVPYAVALVTLEEGCRVTVVPAQTSAEDVLALKELTAKQPENIDDPLAFARGDLAIQRVMCRAARNVGFELLLNTFARFRPAVARYEGQSDVVRYIAHA